MAVTDVTSTMASTSMMSAEDEARELGVALRFGLRLVEPATRTVAAATTVAAAPVADEHAATATTATAAEQAATAAASSVVSSLDPIGRAISEVEEHLEEEAAELS